MKIISCIASYLNRIISLLVNTRFVSTVCFIAVTTLMLSSRSIHCFKNLSTAISIPNISFHRYQSPTLSLSRRMATKSATNDEATITVDGIGRGVHSTISSMNSLSSWRSKIDGSIQKSRKIKGGNYVQIATVGMDGLPHCRTVVFRGFVSVTSAASSSSTSGWFEAMKMITDARSEKVTHIKHSPACEMVWWFSQSSEQYRVSGDLVLVSNDSPDKHLLEARKQQWGNLSDPAR